MQKEYSISEYLEIVGRRKWFAIIPAMALSLIALVVSLFLPPKYSSQTLVLVEQPKINDSIVKPTNVEDLERRLSTMKEQILSRTRLQPIMTKFSLYKDESGKKPLEELLEKMRTAIKISPIKGANNSTPGFYIEFSDKNPKTAQDVCAEITSLFMEENLTIREQHAASTVQFIQIQLEEAQHKLNEQDSKLADFKKKYLGSMPENEQQNMTLLLTTRTQLDTVNEGLSALRQNKSYVEAQLAQMESVWKAAHAQATENPDQLSSQELEAQMKKMKADLALLQARYTADYPDVVRTKASIAQLQGQIDAQQKSTGEHKGTTPAVAQKEGLVPPEIQTLRNNMHGIEVAIALKTTEQEHLTQEVKNYESRLQIMPQVEEEGKALTRDYQQAYASYQDLLAKKTQADMSADLERRQEGEQFRIMDPANLPERPSFPKPELFAAGGLGAGLFIGAALIFILESMSRTIRSESEAEFYLKLPVLAKIPDTTIEVMSGSRRWYQFKGAKAPIRNQPAASGAVRA